MSLIWGLRIKVFGRTNIAPADKIVASSNPEEGFVLAPKLLCRLRPRHIDTRYRGEDRIADPTSNLMRNTGLNMRAQSGGSQSQILQYIPSSLQVS